jgi:hypothetical protein
MILPKVNPEVLMPLAGRQRLRARTLALPDPSAWMRLKSDHHHVFCF